MDYVEDLRSDFSVFHRVDDLEAMAAPRFFALAHRISAYRGVVAVRMEEQMAAAQPAMPFAAASPERPVVDAFPGTVAGIPVLDGLISFGASGG